METPEEAIIINEVNDKQDPEYGMPITEELSVPTMTQLCDGVNKKINNIFGTGTGDFGGSSRPMSIHSGVFGGAVGSSATSPNTSLVRN